MGITLGQAAITATAAGQSATATITTTTGLTFGMVSAGGVHTCALTPDGVAYCWGYNGSGQLGNGTTTNSATPVAVSGQISFATLRAGALYTCGITSHPIIETVPPVGGEMYCWGDNSSGQLGNGTTTSSITPTAVLGGIRFFTLSTGSDHTCGISFDGTLYCWGRGGTGQLGNGTLSNSLVPVASAAMVWASVSAGSNHTCGTVEFAEYFDDSVDFYCWGDNSAGELGDGTTNNSATPVKIATATYFGLTVTMLTGFNYTCAPAPLGLFSYATDSGVPSSSCWGANGYGQLGNGTTMNSAIPVAVAGGLYLWSAGYQHVCGTGAGPAADTTTMYCWGDNSSGQLGNGTTTSSATPVAVASSLNFSSTVSAGDRHTCAVNLANSPTLPGPRGAVYCWGDNYYGQLGNSWTTTSSVPVNVAEGL